MVEIAKKQVAEDQEVRPDNRNARHEEERI